MPSSTNSDNLHRLIYKTRFGHGMLLWGGKALLAHSLPGQPGKTPLAHSSPGQPGKTTLAHSSPGQPGRPVAVRETKKNSSWASGPLAWSRIQLLEPATPGEKKLVRLLEAYFRGKKVDFSAYGLVLPRSGSTGFQTSVTAALAVVPYGQTITYAGLAEAAGHPGACRAVGNLMAANPCPVIIPCHRVVRGDGSLGSYSAGEGWKNSLLQLEGCPFPARANPIESR